MEQTNCADGKKFVVIGIVILLLALIITNVFILRWLMVVDARIEKINELRVNVSPELQTRIEKKFDGLGDKIEQSVMETRLNIVQTMTAKMEEVGKQMKDRAIDSIENALAAANKKLDEKGVPRQLDELKKLVENIQSDREQKAQAYLAAARNNSNNEDVGKILYATSIGYSVNKAPVLKEYAVWQKKIIEKVLKLNQLSEAEERLAAVSVIFDSAIADGAIDDMKAIPELKSELEGIRKLIMAKHATAIAEQNTTLAELESRIDDLKSLSDCDTVLKQLAGMSVDASLDEKKESIVAKILARQSCLTTVNDPVVIPAIDKNTPWVAWFSNFNSRLQNNTIPPSKRLEDLGNVAEFLAAAKEKKDKTLDGEIAKLETNAKKLYFAYWRERADDVIGKMNAPENQLSNLNMVAELLNEANSFSEQELSNNKIIIVRLNEYLLKKTLDELDDNSKCLKELQNTLNTEEVMQLAGSIQGQYLQIMMRIKGLEKKYPDSFHDDIANVNKKISATSQLISGYKDGLAAFELKKTEIQRERFISWAKDQIKEAKRLHDEGENIAASWKKTRGNPEAVAKYKDAWYTLMVIHPGDLRAVDPALGENYDNFKRTIENRWPPNNEDRENISYKRITDF